MTPTKGWKDLIVFNQTAAALDETSTVHCSFIF